MENNTEQFGMTQQDINSEKRSELILKLKQIWAAIEPIFIKVFSTIIYYTIRLGKAFVSACIRMMMGKEA
jgi:hypothetical protein